MVYVVADISVGIDAGFQTQNQSRAIQIFVSIMFLSSDDSCAGAYKRFVAEIPDYTDYSETGRIR